MSSQGLLMIKGQAGDLKVNVQTEIIVTWKIKVGSLKGQMSNVGRLRSKFM